MKPIKFKGFNITYGQNQKELEPLPAHLAENGDVVSCWQLSFKERLLVFVTGKVWEHTRTQHANLQPFRLKAVRPFTRRNRNAKINNGTS